MLGPVLSCSGPLRPAMCVLKSHMSCLDFLHSKHLTWNGKRGPFLISKKALATVSVSCSSYFSTLPSSVTCLNSCPPCDSCVLQSQTPCLGVVHIEEAATRHSPNTSIIFLSSLAFVITAPNYLCLPAVNRCLYNLLFSSIWVGFPRWLQNWSMVEHLQSLEDNFCLFHSSNVSSVFLFPDIQCLDDGVRV